MVEKKKSFSELSPGKKRLFALLGAAGVVIIFAAASESNKWMATFNGENNIVDENGHNAGATPIVLQWQDGRPTCVYPTASANSPILDPNTLQPYQ